MSEINWTDSQKAALEVKGKKVLVSAAAGSGKSTVLTERIIRSITGGGDISKKLVVTFTRASAEDLKAKIAKAVHAEVSKAPNNRYLSQQLLKLPSADIGTIHGICFSLIKKNFHVLDNLPASLRIAEESETATLKIEILNKLIDEAYMGIYSGVDNFPAFADNFITERDDKLIEIFLSLYDKIKNQPNGFDDWRISAQNTASFTDFGKTPFGKIICDNFRIFTDFLKKAYSRAIEYFRSEEAYAKAYLNVFLTEYDHICRLDRSAEEYDWAELKKALEETPKTKLSAVKSVNQTDEGNFYKDLRVYYTRNLKVYREEVFVFSDEEIRFSAEKTSQYCLGITEFLAEFDKRFTAEKLKRSIIDFNDIEHLTLKLLYNKDGSISDTAYAISSSFDEIFVDEYQDVNPLQNMIFNALAVNCPIFMVGDIKQSIYNFRGAVPEIFSDYRRSFTPYEKGRNNYENVTVFLSDNFRSKFPVTEFSNVISDALFTSPEDNGIYSYRIPYSKSDRLVCRKKNDDSPDVEIMIAQPAPKDSPIYQTRTSYSLESEMVANKIAELVANGVSTSDIAILLRSPKTAAIEFEKQLKLRNIPVSSDKGAKLFDAPEVQLALCLLNCADNPYRDIFLAGALKSPIFGFTLDELIEIRQYSEQPSLFAALNVYTDEKNFEKGRYFLDFLKKIRKQTTENSVDKVLWNIYTATSFFTVIYEGGEISETQAASRRSNLLALHQLAKQYSSSGSNGLYAFLERIRLLIENDKSPTSSIEGKGVQILSIHSSKGLEFEHCFLCGTDHDINKTDLSKEIISYAKLGVAMRLKDDIGYTSSDTVFRIALSYLTEQKLIDEEMRMLYVALTRAKSVLYVTGDCGKFDELNNAALYSSKISHPFTYLRDSSYLKWILTALKAETDLAPRFKTTIFSEEEIVSKGNNLLAAKTINIDKETKDDDFDSDKVYRELSERLSFRYPFPHAVNIPSKLSVSRLYPEILDESAYLGDNIELELESDIYGTEKENDLKVPQFLQENTDVSGAEKGTANHVFMQFCDFDNLINNGIEPELERLTENRFILDSHAALVDKKYISDFLKSDICKEMLASKQLQREYRFNIKLPASDFTADDQLKDELKNEFLFVQGVIDCYFYDENGNLILLDYKTDKVPRDIRNDKEKEDNFFIERYCDQLRYYRAALNKLCGKTVFKTVIYSFALGRSIIIP